MGANTETPLVPDDTLGDQDVDPAVEDRHSTLTQSLRESLLESVKENGRGYHRYTSTAGSEYPVPEDEIEQERLDLQHEMFLFTFHGRLYQSPIGEDVKNVLDLGTGTGIWAVDFAEDHPQAEVLGTDLSPIQPQHVPPNCKFEIDDYNSEWTFSHKFDFIYARGMTGTTKDFPTLIRQAYDALNPGGWLEMVDIQVPFLDIDGTSKGTMVGEWSKRMVESCKIAGIDISAASNYKQWMTEQGFENVTELTNKWPVGTWAKDSRAKYIGKINMTNFLTGLEGFSLRLWIGCLQMSYEQVMEDLEKIRKDIVNPKIHLYWPVYTVYGQKPAKV